MKKYIDAEKLIAEIERREKIIRNSANQISDSEKKTYYSGCADALLELLPFVTSLHQEQPDNEDIDKVAQELYEHLYELKRRNNVPTDLYNKQEIINLWKAGIEYAYNHPKQEQPEVYLEKAARNVYESWMGGTMNDVRRDMVNLGKVLNARKEE